METAIKNHQKVKYERKSVLDVAGKKTSSTDVKPKFGEVALTDEDGH